MINVALPVHGFASAFNLFCDFLAHFLNPGFMPTNNTFDSSLVIDPLNRQALNTDVRSLLEINALRSASRYAVVSGGAFTDNGSSNFAGVVSNPFDDARVYANGAVTINGTPLFSGFGNGLTLGPTGVLQNVSATIATSLKLGRVAESVTIDVPAYWVPTIGVVERTIDVSQFPLNGAADVEGAFGAFRYQQII